LPIIHGVPAGLQEIIGDTLEECVEGMCRFRWHENAGTLPFGTPSEIIKFPTESVSL